MGTSPCVVLSSIGSWTMSCWLLTSKVTPRGWTKSNKPSVSEADTTALPHGSKERLLMFFSWDCNVDHVKISAKLFYCPSHLYINRHTCMHAQLHRHRYVHTLLHKHFCTHTYWRNLYSILLESDYHKTSTHHSWIPPPCWDLFLSLLSFSLPLHLSFWEMWYHPNSLMTNSTLHLHTLAHWVLLWGQQEP